MCDTVTTTHNMSEQDHVGFYLLPRSGRDPSPPSPRHLQHRLSIINEVSEESSAASTPLSSPNHRPYKQKTSVDQNINHSPHRGRRPGRRSNISVENDPKPLQSPGDKLYNQQDIILHTSGRGQGYQNDSHQR